MHLCQHSHTDQILAMLRLSRNIKRLVSLDICPLISCHNIYTRHPFYRWNQGLGVSDFLQHMMLSCVIQLGRWEGYHSDERAEKNESGILLAWIWSEMTGCWPFSSRMEIAAYWTPSLTEYVNIWSCDEDKSWVCPIQLWHMELLLFPQWHSWFWLLVLLLSGWAISPEVKSSCQPT